MSTRVWWLTALTAVLLVAAVVLAGGASRQLRSEHSQPARMLPQTMVAVTPQGKLFHDPNCRYIHGPKQMMSADEAVRLGYTPCTRCMRKALE